jgi:transposase
MNLATTFDSLDREGLIGVAVAQAEAIERLSAKAAALEAKVAQLQAKLERPPKTPDNSSIPPRFFGLKLKR